MPTSNRPSPLAARLAAAPRRHDDDYPLWRGPCGDGPLGGITQSMLVRFLSCRERFRLKYVLGLEPPDKWNHRIGYGNMWHVCEEALAGVRHCEARPYGEEGHWEFALLQYAQDQASRHPLQRDEITKWLSVCEVQFPEYVRYWADHPDVVNRTPLLQEQVFDVPYTLPSGRVVRLRGKFDSVDLIDGGIYLQENKTKGDIDKVQVERQLKFDLQTMLYLTALTQDTGIEPLETAKGVTGDAGNGTLRFDTPVRGVRYNVVRRPLSGGKGNISPHKARYTKTKVTPAETEAEFYERLRRDYIAAEPDYWFFRVRAEVSQHDLQVFRDTCLDPLLETVCWWYDEVTNTRKVGGFGQFIYSEPPANYRTPFGVYSALEEGGATEYDAYLDNGSEAGLQRVKTLFGELQ